MSGEADTTSRRDRLAVVVHELRSPVAALSALAAAAPGVPPAERGRLLLLALAAARDVERILADRELVSLRRERVDVGTLASAFGGDDVSVSAADPAPVHGDPTRLRQVLANLVANGLRHGSRVEVAVTELDGWVVVDVVDDGPGLDPALDPFARGASAAGSTGLGLWLGRAIAEAHGGSLEHVPGAGPGARFRLALPSASGAE